MTDYYKLNLINSANPVWNPELLIKSGVIKVNNKTIII